MNYQLYTYQIPSTVTFFEGKVEQGIGFIYGLSTIADGTKLIKMPVGTYSNYTFTPFINFTKNGQTVNIFEQNYPERNAYKATCNLYYTPSGTDLNAQTYYFAKTSETTAEKTVIIKNLLNDGVVFKEDGIKNFCYNDLAIYSSINSTTHPVLISLASGPAGEKVFNAFVNNEVGYVTILDCRDVATKITILPACKYYNDPIIKSQSYISSQISTLVSTINLTTTSGVSSLINLPTTINATSTQIYTNLSTNTNGASSIININLSTINNIQIITSVSNTSASFFGFDAFCGKDNLSACTDIFNLVWPESKSRTNGRYNLYNIINNDNYYYNNVDKKFVSNINAATWYFSDVAANRDVSEAASIANANVSVTSDYNVCIKDLVTYGIEFPCSSFICDNINDYIIIE